MKEVDGLLNAKRPKPPSPKASPKDFVWPSQADHDDKTAQKIAASLQELLPPKEWTHSDLARELWGANANGQPRNIGASRRWIVAEHPIPNEETAGYIAEVLGVSMARLLEPEGKFNPHPPMIRPRSPDGVHVVRGKKVKVKQKGVGRGNYIRKKKKVEAAAPAKRKYVRRAPPPPAVNGHERDPNAWVLAEGIPVPDYTLESSEDYPGHLKISVTAVVPHSRAMAILHMLEHVAPEE
jgi:hypothetical protein